MGLGPWRVVYLTCLSLSSHVQQDLGLGHLSSPAIKSSYYNLVLGYMYICVEVLWPSQPNGVMLSAVSLPNHRLSPLSGLPVLCTFFCQKLITALLESAEGKE